MPYRFDPKHVVVSRKALRAGDYSLEGMEKVVAVERKSLPDFVASVIHSRDRFARELKRLGTYDAAFVLVEADLQDVLDRRYRSHAHPHAVLGSMVALFVDYGVPFIFCSNRENAGRITAGFLMRYHRRAVTTDTEVEVCHAG